jgi:cytochrome c oxidase subunit 2
VRAATESKAPVRRRRRALGLLGPSLLLLVATTGCDPSFGYPKSITPQGERMRHLWIGSCFAAAVVGLFVVVLIGYSVIVHRKRDDELPKQVALNLPIEVLYTVVPFVIIGALFFYTARDEIYVNKTTSHPAAHGVDVIDVEAFQWGWTFRYLTDSGTAGAPNGAYVYDTGSSNTTEPTLVLPTNTPVQFQLHSNNVIHDFYVPSLLYKLDVIPGRTNTFEVTDLQRPGIYEGHCAELCGYDHARMNFNLKVVSKDDYQAYLRSMVTQGSTAPIPAWVTSSTPPGSIA